MSNCHVGQLILCLINVTCRTTKDEKDEPYNHTLGTRAMSDGNVRPNGTPLPHGLLFAMDEFGAHRCSYCNSSSQPCDDVSLIWLVLLQTVRTKRQPYQARSGSTAESLMLKFSDGYGRKPGMLPVLASICGVIKEMHQINGGIHISQ